MSQSPKTESFEDNLSHLESLVKQLEDGNLPLEDSINIFESGVKLVKECQNQLENAKIRIEEISKEGEI